MKLQIGRKLSANSLMLSLLSVMFIYATLTFVRLQYSFYVAVAAYAGFYLLSVHLKFRWNLNNRTTIWFIVSAFVSSLYIINGEIERVTLYLSCIIYIFFWSNAFHFLAINFSIHTLRKYCVFNLSVLLVSVIATLRVLSMYPLASRAIYGRADGLTDTAFLFPMGCGGFGFIYGFVFITIGLIAIIKSKEANDKLRLFCFLYLILSYSLILKAQFSTAIVLSISIILLFAISRSEHYLVGYIAIALAGLIAFFMLDEILNLLSKLADSMGISLLTGKVSMITSAIYTKNYNSLSRVQVYIKSIEGFMSNPVFGSGVSGEHSQIIDTFSSIGLFAVPFVGLILSCIRSFERYIPKKYILVLKIIVVISAALNPFVDMTLLSIAFMLCPCLIYCSLPYTKRGEI